MSGPRFEFLIGLRTRREREATSPPDGPIGVQPVCDQEPSVPRFRFDPEGAFLLYCETERIMLVILGFGPRSSIRSEPSLAGVIQW